MGLFDIKFGKQHNLAEQKKEVKKVKWEIVYEYQYKRYEVIDYFPINAVPADARRYVENLIGTHQFNLLFFTQY